MTASGFAIEVAAVTHVGCVRSSNDDTVAVDAWRGNGTMPNVLRTRLDTDRPHVVLVCDGMGGQPGGDVASHAAAGLLSELLAACADCDAIASRIAVASENLHDLARQDAALQWMGTTVAGLVIAAEGCFWFNVGDSSVFRFGTYLVKLSHDDTIGGRRTGAILQALGGTATMVAIKPHVGEQSLEEGTRFLLCSDGLTDAVGMDEMEAEMHGDARDIVERLLTAALAAGAHDNVSIIVVHIVAQEVRILN